MDRDLNERLFAFAVRCLRFMRTLSDSSEHSVIKYQLAKSSTSSGANYEESQAASSHADFINKIKISPREMRESNYWLRVIKEINESDQDSEELHWLVNESDELKRILGSIAKNKLS